LAVQSAERAHHVRRRWQPDSRRKWPGLLSSAGGQRPIGGTGAGGRAGGRRAYEVLQRRVGALHRMLPLVWRDAFEPQRAMRQGGGRCLLERLPHTRHAVSVQYGRHVVQQFRRHLPRSHPVRPLSVLSGKGGRPHGGGAGGEGGAAPRRRGPAVTRVKTARRRTAAPAPVSREGRLLRVWERLATHGRGSCASAIRVTCVKVERAPRERSYSRFMPHAPSTQPLREHPPSRARTRQTSVSARRRRDASSDAVAGGSSANTALRRLSATSCSILDNSSAASLASWRTG
jgi:hypothetical protein